MSEVSFIAEYQTIWIASLAIALVILCAFTLGLAIRLGSMRKRYVKMVNGEQDVNVEELLIRIQQKLDEQRETVQEQKRELVQLQEKVKKSKGHAAVVRYSAFSGTGNNLSFSLALIDDEKDGIILSGIHNRDHSYVYAKPVEKGQSSYTLSPEEKDALSQALPGKNGER
ncbi:DUF4446 family protein [Marinicrinis sediminis]|uniref:DUF4446 family protein n=1 Tax=Marinicrinis sediminis TaxID=1652465 RepID=A0ABW5RC73_9BACL